MARAAKTDDGVLKAMLAQMFLEASGTGKPVKRITARGLHLKALVRPSGSRELLLWRLNDRLPSKQECTIVARDAGFAEPKWQAWNCEGHDGFHVRDLASQVVKSTKQLTTTVDIHGAVCGTCGHGLPDGEMVACELGWEAHEGYHAFRNKNQPAQTISTGHPGVPVPLLAPQTRCMAWGGRWVPRERRA